MKEINTTVCIAGGGPAGMMLGMLLSNAGIKTLVVEKHRDFLRDFRGDTVHPSTLEIFNDLNLLESFLTTPHEKAQKISAVVGDVEIPVADFSHLPTHAKFIAFMPQWDFLNYVKDIASKSENFQLLMDTEIIDIIQENGCIVGALAKTKEGDLQIRSNLLIGADGRHSTVREKASLQVEDLGAPIDVLWMRISRNSDDPPQLFGRFNRGRIFVMLNRHDYWQCAYVIKKGGMATVKSKGLNDFHESIRKVAPFLGERVKELKDWETIKLLNVQVDRLKDWSRDGLLCIGDAAHAMSPVGGVGINLAIQDAVATANLIVPALLKKQLNLSVLKAVQKRRSFPTRMTQFFQIQAHKRVLSKVLTSESDLRPPLFLRMVGLWPWLRRIPALFIGIGFRPEHPDKSLFKFT